MQSEGRGDEEGKGEEVKSALFKGQERESGRRIGSGERPKHPFLSSEATSSGRVQRAT